MLQLVLLPALLRLILNLGRASHHTPYPPTPACFSTKFLRLASASGLEKVSDFTPNNSESKILPANHSQPFAFPNSGRVGDALREFIVEPFPCQGVYGGWRSSPESWRRRKQVVVYMALLAQGCFCRADSDPPSVDLLELAAVHLCLRDMKPTQGQEETLAPEAPGGSLQGPRWTCGPLGDLPCTQMMHFLHPSS